MTFWAYVRWDRLSGLPAQEPLPPRGTLPAPAYFDERDTHGRQPAGTRQPRLARAALRGKRKLNLQIREWAGGREDIPVEELRADFPWLPTWVWKAVERQ